MEKNKVGAKPEIVFIGGSAGSLSALLDIFSQISNRKILPLVIVIHRLANTNSMLTGLLSSRTHLYVKEADEKEIIRHNTVYIAPADYHLLIEKNHSFSMDASEKINFSRPSIDATFESGTGSYGEKQVCILLSGANADGSNGMMKAKQAGAITIAQNPLNSEFPYMPDHAIKKGAAGSIMTPKEIGVFINEL